MEWNTKYCMDWMDRRHETELVLFNSYTHCSAILQESSSQGWTSCGPTFHLDWILLFLDIYMINFMLQFRLKNASEL